MRLRPVIVAMLLPMLMISRTEAGALADGILVLPPGSCILRARQRAKCPSLPRLDFRGRNSPIRVVRCRGGAKGAVPSCVPVSAHQPALCYGVIRQSVCRADPEETSSEGEDG